MKIKFIRKLKIAILLVVVLISLCTTTFATSGNQESESTTEEAHEFYSKLVESENTNEGVKVTIVKSDKYGDFQDEYVSVDVKVENLNRYSDLEFNIEAIDNEGFKIHSKNQRYIISAGSNEDISFDYSFNKPTAKYDPKKNVKYKKDIAFARDSEHATSSYISERYIRDRERTEREELELKKKEQQETKKTIMILAIVFIVVFIVLIAIYFIRRYIRTHEDFYNILLMIGLSLIISLCTMFNKTYAYTQQTFMSNTTYSHTYNCEVWHGGIAYTFRYRVSYKYVGEVPTYPEDQDSDGDGLVDNYEVYFITDLNSVDTDGDGISDYDEIYTIDTDPLKADTDKNGKDDGDEDYDKDGLTNIEEKNLGTYMNDKDSDYDGLSDYDEVKVYYTDPLKADTDNDGLSDYEEVEVMKKLGLEDISSIDRSVKFNQTLSRDNMDKELYMNNIMSISVEGNVPGLIDKHIELKSTDNVSLTSAESVLGKENTDLFKNDDYVNGIRVSYDKTNANIPNGASNFNDIIAVMSVLYEQKMDTKTIDELKETFTRLFWLSHTYTYNSDELYPCRHGCLAENNYKCTAVYNDYRNTRYLKYELFTVPYHEEYVDLGYDERENFRIVVPSHQCTVHGQRGAGCEWDSSKTCYHGSGMQTFASCELKINTEPRDDADSGSGDSSDSSENDSEGTSYGEVGDEVIPENTDEMYLEADPIQGQKVSRTDSTCRYYKIIKLCNTRKTLLTQIKSAKKTLKDAEKAEQRHSASCTYDGDGECSTCRNNAENVQRASEKVTELETELNEHITTVCEVGETGSKYWCDGYKLCMGHKDHYKCEGKHKVILCSGHTNINVEIKVMYNKELLDEALKVFN